MNEVIIKKSKILLPKGKVYEKTENGIVIKEKEMIVRVIEK